MSYRKKDTVFLDAFKDQFKDHIKKAYVPGGLENQAQDMINKAILEGSPGRLSRLFDALEIPIVSEHKLKKRLAKAGSLEAYILPIIQGAASLLLTDDLSKVKPEVIDAIGLNNYAKLTGGKIDNGRVVANNKTHVKQFRAQEKVIAQNILLAVIVDYNEILTDQINNRLKEITEKNSEILNVLSQMKQTMTSGTFDEEAMLVDINTTIEKDVLNKTNEELIESANNAISVIKNLDVATIAAGSNIALDGLYQVMKAQKMLQEYKRNESIALEQTIITPSKRVLEDFSLDQLNVKNRSVVTVDKLYKEIRRYEIFLESIIEKSVNNESLKPDERDVLMQGVAASKNILINAYEAYYMHKDMPQDYSAEIALGKMKSEFQDSMIALVEKVDVKMFEVQPSKSFTSILYTIFSNLHGFISDMMGLGEDKRRERKEQGFLNKLLMLKGNAAATLENNEQAFLIETDDLSASRFSSEQSSPASSMDINEPTTSISPPGSSMSVDSVESDDDDDFIMNNEQSAEFEKETGAFFTTAYSAPNQSEASRCAKDVTWDKKVFESLYGSSSSTGFFSDSLSVERNKTLDSEKEKVEKAWTGVTSAS